MQYCVDFSKAIYIIVAFPVGEGGNALSIDGLGLQSNSKLFLP
jgi:hypothetical protein